MPRKAVKFAAGDVLAIPLDDGSFGFGQILTHEYQALDAIVCRLFSHRSSGEADLPAVRVTDAPVIAALFVTSDLARSAVWRIVGSAPAPRIEDYVPDILKRREVGFVGTTVYGSANVRAFLSAYFGLTPWSAYHDPAYFDKMLINAQARPSNILWDPTKK